MRLLGHHKRDGMLAGVGEADSPFAETKLLSALGGAAVQADNRLAAMVSGNLDVFPADAVAGQYPHPHTQCFGDGLLGSEAGRKDSGWYKR